MYHFTQRAALCSVIEHCRDEPRRRFPSENQGSRHEGKMQEFENVACDWWDPRGGPNRGHSAHLWGNPHRTGYLDWASVSTPIHVQEDGLLGLSLCLHPHPRARGRATWTGPLSPPPSTCKRTGYLDWGLCPHPIHVQEDGLLGLGALSPSTCKRMGYLDWASASTPIHVQEDGLLELEPLDFQVLSSFDVPTSVGRLTHPLPFLSISPNSPLGHASPVRSFSLHVLRLVHPSCPWSSNRSSPPSLCSEVALRVSHSSLMSSDRMKPGSGDWAVTINFLEETSIASLSIGSSVNQVPTSINALLARSRRKEVEQSWEINFHHTRFKW
uniref:(California timema) hypothetical protein n=1 Tax=Timema californicum TaxID=61474 RepID=A0A7R9JFZ5_TIMCA|nr:unnamed protein product [Timema californicum]